MRSHRSSAVAASPIAVLSVIALLAAACGKAPPAVPPALTIAAAPDAKTSAPLTITASADANPDRNGRPSPVVVRVYQLKTDAAFKAVSFSDLYDDEDKALGAELISRDEFVMEPQQNRTLNVAIAGDTRYVGVIAAFRDILNAEWRALVPAPRKGLTVAVERGRLLLSPAE